ncbi:NAD(P)/FAD-dependent oxidoreductase [Microbacterium sp. H1-D42]|uniref:NAD(P)/FAD-dependent oxidoreductase n=1 Tax=Microbacterium sp. H1-D42 TaxID=2925844 RepID=UPI001F531CC1|nr:NAD(P)/FAD-dependent oxidoreductase [Microbacterium sp. H1-D42]UNK70219.1 NAD(P)/FAD-dependent oxidoreductase [Microbacterium sp. H1-D42]
MREVIIIGAGPAGLQAALTLGRMHRTALVIDSGEYRNGPVQHMHNVIADDGTPPAEFRERARRQLAEYATVEFRHGSITRVSPIDGSFEAIFADGTVERSTRVLLATGMADDLPPVPGLAELWGRHAFSCPFCDGHEYAGRRIGVIGGSPRVEHLVKLLKPIVSDIIVFDDGELADEMRSQLETLGASVHSATVESVTDHDNGVRITAGGPVDVDGLFVAAGSARQRAPFAEQLGLTMLDSGAIEIDEFGRTSLPGVSAAGDLAHRAALPGVMAAVMVAATAGQLAAAGLVQELAG